MDVEARGADRFEHVGHGGLAFEGGVEVVEQSGVGDGDRRVVGERLQDLGAGLVERADVEPTDVDVADPFVLVEERDRHERTDLGVPGDLVVIVGHVGRRIVDEDRGVMFRSGDFVTA